MTVGPLFGPFVFVGLYFIYYKLDKKLYIGTIKKTKKNTHLEFETLPLLIPKPFHLSLPICQGKVKWCGEVLVVTWWDVLSGWYNDTGSCHIKTSCRFYCEFTVKYSMPHSSHSNPSPLTLSPQTYPTSPILYISSHLFFHPTILITSPYSSHPFHLLQLFLSSHFSLFPSFPLTISGWSFLIAHICYSCIKASAFIPSGSIMTTHFWRNVLPFWSLH